MNREIKFRAWAEVYQSHHRMIEWDEMLKKWTSYQFTHPQEYNCVLMQYTGFKDKNGKEIYEGDIVRQWLEDRVEPDGGLWWHCEIKLHKGCWCLLQKGISYEYDDPNLLHDDHKHLEVIGNIYQNSELLKNE